MSKTLNIKWLGHNSLLGTVMTSMPHGFTENEICFVVEHILSGVDLVQEIDHLKEQFPHITFKLFQQAAEATFNGLPVYNPNIVNAERIAELLKNDLQNAYEQAEAKGNWGFIHAIKVLRERTGMGLVDAKTFMETFFPQFRIRKNGR